MRYKIRSRTSACDVFPRCDRDRSHVDRGSPQFRNFNFFVFFVRFFCKSAQLKRMSSSDQETDRAVRCSARKNPEVHARWTRPRVARPRGARALWPLLVCEPGARGATRIMTTTCAIMVIRVAFCWPTPQPRIQPPRRAICGHPQLQCLQVWIKSARLKRSS